MKTNYPDYGRLVKLVLNRIPDYTMLRPLWIFYPPGQGYRWLRLLLFALVPLRSEKKGGLYTLLYGFCLSILWPLKSIVLACRYTQQVGSEVSKVSGKSTGAQLFEQIRLAIGYSINPREYYTLSLYKVKNRSRLNEYLFLKEPAFLNSLFRKQDPADRIQNKKQFQDFCCANNLACVQGKILYSKGPLFWGDQLNKELKQGPLVVKAVTGSKGDQIWYLEPEKQGIRVNHGQYLKTAELKDWLHQHLTGDEYLIQPLLHNHKAIRNLSNGWLCSLRVVTATGRDKSPQTVGAVFQMPAWKRLTSNSGIFAAVNPTDGSLCRAYSFRLLCSGFDCHPDTGQRISGQRIPYWPEALSLAVNAHTRLGIYPSIGWDIALTDSGPLLLEGNTGWDPELMQKAIQGPLGSDLFFEAAFFLQN